MNAAAISAFERNVMQPTFERAYPGRVFIEGKPYDGSVIKGKLQPFDLVEGGEEIHQPLLVTISKTLLSRPHDRGTTLIYQKQGWKIETVGGDNETDAAWLYTCARAPGADL